MIKMFFESCEFRQLLTVDTIEILARATYLPYPSHSCYKAQWNACMSSTHAPSDCGAGFMSIGTRGRMCGCKICLPSDFSFLARFPSPEMHTVPSPVVSLKVPHYSDLLMYYLLAFLRRILPARLHCSSALLSWSVILLKK